MALSRDKIEISGDGFSDANEVGNDEVVSDVAVVCQSRPAAFNAKI
jgi:hypothetical protein